MTIYLWVLLGLVGLALAFLVGWYDGFNQAEKLRAEREQADRMLMNQHNPLQRRRGGL